MVLVHDDDLHVSMITSCEPLVLLISKPSSLCSDRCERDETVASSAKGND